MLLDVGVHPVQKVGIGGISKRQTFRKISGKADSLFLDRLQPADKDHSSGSEFTEIDCVAAWLPSFHVQHPDIELRISATVELADFKRDGIDLAIRLGHGRYAGLQAEPLFSEALTPLCSPKILKGKGRLKTPEDLRKHRIIHDTSISGQGEHSAWDKWLALAGAKHFSARRGVRFTLAELAMQAAIDGAGIVLGRLVLAEGDIAAGRLVRPFKIALPLEVSYFFVRAEGAAPRSELLHFRNWLFSSLKKSSLNGTSRSM